MPSRLSGIQYLLREDVDHTIVEFYAAPQWEVEHLFLAPYSSEGGETFIRIH
jgi:hypothetical protein